MSTAYTLKLISWNVRNSAEKSASRQIKELGKEAPDVVALQDVNPNAVSAYKKQCSLIGLDHSVHTLHGVAEDDYSGVFIASSFPLDQLPRLPSSALWSTGIRSAHIHTLEKHWAKRTLFVSINSPWSQLNLYTVYITPFYNKSHEEITRSGKKKGYSMTKLDMLAGLYQELSSYTHKLRILCGDFNTPQKENPNGEIITWGYKYIESTGRYFLPASGQYQHHVEINILRGLGEYYDLPDVYRRVHGYANSGSDEAISHVQVRRDKHTAEERLYKWRYDHVFASKDLHPLSVRYLQNLRRPDLSDHAPIEVVFDLTHSIKSEALK
jgi:exonuclease III